MSTKSDVTFAQIACAFDTVIAVVSLVMAFTDNPICLLVTLIALASLSLTAPIANGKD